ncbi:hypothetical protein EDD11_008521 [Mortierella claussenii]|nr:hypothetical protein EDD11_008521 [Mortierella claussenii]
MSDLLPIPPTSFRSSSSQDHVSRQTARLIHLLESTEYPYEISEQELRNALSTFYCTESQQQPLHASLHGRSTAQESTPVADFLDWLLENVSAETNWPGYRSKQTLSPPLTLDSIDRLLDQADHGEGSDYDEEDAALLSLDQEHAQLQSTLSCLERELSDLKALEIHAIDTNRQLDMDIHSISVQLDANVTKLEELAHSVLAKHLPKTPISVERTTRTDVDMSDGIVSSNKRFLYQFQDQLTEIQQLDRSYLHTITSMVDQILNTVNTPSIYATNSSSSLSSTSAPASAPVSAPAPPPSSTSHLEWLLKRNPAQDRELVRLCSTYRATKMSHIRAMAQLKCLEEQLRYMKDLEAQYPGDSDNQSNDLTGDYTRMYTIASSKNQQIQQIRQQEIELISVQRETARLMDEMEQLLSDPHRAPSPSSVGHGDSRMRHRSSNGKRNSLPSNSTSYDTSATEGVLGDICERIARTDIELRFLSAAHRDYLREQEHAQRELDKVVDGLLEYYSLGLVIDKMLEQEQGVMQMQVETLWAAVEEVREAREQSRRIHRVWKTNFQGSRSTHIENLETGPDRDTSDLLEAVKESERLAVEAQHENQTMQDHIEQMINIRDFLDNELLNRHSSTRELHLVPKAVHDIKSDLAKRTRKLQQDYTTLHDQVQQLIQKKSSSHHHR